MNCDAEYDFVDEVGCEDLQSMNSRLVTAGSAQIAKNWTKESCAALISGRLHKSSTLLSCT